MTWCEFIEVKKPLHYYYIEASFNEACDILKERTGLDINTNENYICHEESKTYKLITGHQRGLRCITVPKINKLYQNDDPIVQQHVYLEIGEVVTAGYFTHGGENPQTIKEFEARPDVTVWRKETLI